MKNYGSKKGYYFLNLTGADPETIDGSLCENFVYLHLVKRGRNTANTANSLLARGKLNYIYNLKKTYGGIEGRKYTVPLYLAGRIRFDLDQ